MVAGDTRFDRVADIAAAAKRLEVVEEFVNAQLPVLVVGSSWGPDEDLLTRYINERAGRMKMIIAHTEKGKNNDKGRSNRTV